MLFAERIPLNRDIGLRHARQFHSEDPCSLPPSRASVRGLAECAGHTTFTSRNTLRKSLTKVKGRPGILDVKGVVNSIHCANDCSATYIGETGRTLK